MKKLIFMVRPKPGETIDQFKARVKALVQAEQLLQKSKKTGRKNENGN